MSAPQVPSNNDALTTLQSATHGLLFPSESDKPIKAFVWKNSTGSSPNLAAAIDANLLQTNGVVPSGATVQPLTAEAFFAPETADESWFGADEKATAQRFRDLEALLNRLSKVTAFRVTSADPRAIITAYVVGYTGEGDVAGITTELVET